MFQHNKQMETKDFYVKTQFEKNHKEEREFIIFSRDYSELCRVFMRLQILWSSPFLHGSLGVQVLCSAVIGDANFSNLHDLHIGIFL